MYRRLDLQSEERRKYPHPLLQSSNLKSVKDKCKIETLFSDRVSSQGNQVLSLHNERLFLLLHDAIGNQYNILFLINFNLNFSFQIFCFVSIFDSFNLKRLSPFRSSIFIMPRLSPHCTCTWVVGVVSRGWYSNCEYCFLVSFFVKKIYF